MTLAASSQRSQIIRSKFRSVLQLRIHRRYQDPSVSGSLTTSSVLDPDPWVSATGPALAPASPSGPTPFLFSSGDLLPESEYGPWRSLKESPKISQHWREPKPKGNLTYHQYMPPGPRQGSRVDPQAKMLALGPPGPPLWEGTNSQRPPPRYASRFRSLPESQARSILDSNPRVQEQGSLAPSPFLSQFPGPSPVNFQESWLQTQDTEPPVPAPHAQGLASSETQNVGPSPSSSHPPPQVFEDPRMPFLSPPRLTSVPPTPTTTTRMKPIPLTPSPPGIPSASASPHKLELQTLKLEELTVSELRQQLRLRGLPVSGTKSMLLERMRGGALPRERPKPRREDSSASAPWPRLRPKALGAVRRPGSLKSGQSCHPPPLPRAAETQPTAPAPARAPALTPASAPSTAAPSLEEELQEAIRRAQLLPNRGIDDILEDQMEPDDQLPPIPLDFPGSFDVLSPSPDSEGLSSVFSSSLPSPTNSPSPSPRGPTDSLDWLEALSGGPLLGCGPPAPSVFSADLSDPSGTRLWDLLDDPW